MNQKYRSNGTGGWILDGNTWVGGVQQLAQGVDCKDFVTIVMIETQHTALVGTSHHPTVAYLDKYWQRHRPAADQVTPRVTTLVPDWWGLGYPYWWGGEAPSPYPVVARSYGQANHDAVDAMQPGDIIIFGTPYSSPDSPKYLDAHAAIYVGRDQARDPETGKWFTDDHMVIGATGKGVQETPISWLGEYWDVTANGAFPGYTGNAPAGNTFVDGNGHLQYWYPYWVTGILHTNLSGPATRNTLPPPPFGTTWTPSPPVVAAWPGQGSSHVQLNHSATVVKTQEGTGLPSRLESNLPATFQVTGAAVPSTAYAVTGTLTVTADEPLVVAGLPMRYPSATGDIYLGAVPIVSPTTSAIHFNAGATASTEVTVGLSSIGTLSATYFNTATTGTVDITFEVTGYDLRQVQASTYHPLTPTQILDTATGKGLTGKFTSGSPRTLTVPKDTVPPQAIAVTGDLMVSNQTAAGNLCIGPTPQNAPMNSALNFPAGDKRSSGVTVALSNQVDSTGSKTVSITYFGVAGATADVTFNVTGYFAPDRSGYTFHQLSQPVRILNTVGKTGPEGQFSSNVARSFQVTGGTSGVPVGATVVTGNLTVVNQSAAGSLSIGSTDSSGLPPALVFPAGDTRAEGVTVKLSDQVDSTGSKTVSITYSGVAGAKADVIFDVTGYYAPYTPDAPGLTFHPLALTRILNTVSGIGLTGKFTSCSPRPLPVTGVPPDAVAVTGTLTVTRQTAPGYLYIGPTNQACPATTTSLNFPAGDDRANGVTVTVSNQGGTGPTLYITYGAAAGATADVVFDVTGYYTASSAVGFAVSELDAPVAGTSASFKVTAVDSSGGTALFYDGTVHFTGDPVDPSATLPGDHQFTPADLGVHTFTATFTKAGQQKVTVSDTDTASVIGSKLIAVAPGSPAYLQLSPENVTVGVGVPQAYTALAFDAFDNPIGDVTKHVTFTMSDGGSCDGASCTSSTAGTYRITGTYSTASGTATLTLDSAGVTHFAVSGFQPSSVAGAPIQLTVSALDQAGNPADGYDGPIHFASSDPAAILPKDGDSPALSGGVGTFTVTLGTMGPQSVTVTSVTTPSITVSQSVEVTASDGASYHPLTPTQILNTATGKGLTGKFNSCSPRTLSVPKDTVPPQAIAVTGDLMVSSQTALGYLYIGPTDKGCPATTTSLNFPAGDKRSSGVTVALSNQVDSTGSKTVSITYGAATGAMTDVTFNVTGYFTPDRSGYTFHPLAKAARVLNTIAGTGLTGRFSSNVARSFRVTGGTSGVPVGATAVTGNLTVVNQTVAGSLSIGPTDSPGPSALVFPTGDARAEGVTVALSAQAGTASDPYKTLSVTYVAGSGKADVIFDVTGYYTPDETGYTFHALAPARVLNTVAGTGLSGQFSGNTARSFQVTGATSGAPVDAVAVTGSLTVTRQTAAGYLYIGPSATNSPATSVLNFPAGDTRANGVTVTLTDQVGTGATAYRGLYVIYGAASGYKADVIFDVTGYFAL